MIRFDVNRLAAILILALAATGCGSSDNSASSTTAQKPTSSDNSASSTAAQQPAGKPKPQSVAPKPKPKPVAVSPPPGYGGLGSDEATFKSKNPQAPSNPSAVPGLAWYTVTDTDANGRVTAFTMTENFKPQARNRERMALTDGIDLPIDAKQTGPNTYTCIVWRSAKLKQYIGLEYAVATTATGTTSADMQAPSSPTC